MLRRGKWDRTYRTLDCTWIVLNSYCVCGYVYTKRNAKGEKATVFTRETGIGYAHTNSPNKLYTHRPSVLLLITLAFMCWHASTWMLSSPTYTLINMISYRFAEKRKPSATQTHTNRDAVRLLRWSLRDIWIVNWFQFIPSLSRSRSARDASVCTTSMCIVLCVARALKKSNRIDESRREVNK